MIRLSFWWPHQSETKKQASLLKTAAIHHSASVPSPFLSPLSAVRRNQCLRRTERDTKMQTQRAHSLSHACTHYAIMMHKENPCVALLSEFALRLEPLFVLKVLDLEKKGMEQFCSTVFRNLKMGWSHCPPWKLFITRSFESFSFRWSELWGKKKVYT